MPVFHWVKIHHLQICAAREEDDALRDLRLDSPDAFLYLNQGEASIMSRV